MDKRCTVCNHSQAHEINLALLAGITLDNLKQQFGLSRSALQTCASPCWAASPGTRPGAGKLKAGFSARPSISMACPKPWGRGWPVSASTGPECT